jgi:hypothetical protein
MFMVSEILACSSSVLPVVVVKICTGSPRNEGGFTYAKTCCYGMSEACTIPSSGSQNLSASRGG